MDVAELERAAELDESLVVDWAIVAPAFERVHANPYWVLYRRVVDRELPGLLRQLDSALAPFDSSED